MTKWPRDKQADLIAFYGDPGKNEIEKQLVSVVLPFRMYYTDDAGKRTTVTAIRVHRKCAASFARAYQLIWDYYAHDQKRIDDLHLSEHCGTYNKRYVRGSTTKWSNHSYGAADDIYCSENKQGSGQGKMPKPVVAAFKSEGASWGADYQHSPTDPMHFEFCDRGEPVRTFAEWLQFYGCPPAAITNETHAGPLPPAAPIPTPVTKSTPDLRHRMARAIADFESRRDNIGNLQVYVLPAIDRGGTYEVGGFNDKYHPVEAAKLRTLVQSGRFDEAETYLEDQILNYTRVAEQWTKQPGVEFFLRDCVLNRGPTGAAKIVQRALGVSVDGGISDEDQTALTQHEPNSFLLKLRASREAYEREDVGYRADLWKGLVSRWDKALAQAQSFQRETAVPVAPVAKTATTTVVVVAGAAAGTVATTTAASHGLDWPLILPIAAIVAVAIAIVIVKLWPTKKEEVQ